jgi:hypothetical protein
LFSPTDAQLDGLKNNFNNFKFALKLTGDGCPEETLENIKKRKK